MKKVTLSYHKDTGLLTTTVINSGKKENLECTISNHIFCDIVKSILDSNEIDCIEMEYNVEKRFKI